MDNNTIPSATTTAVSGRHLPLLLLLFVGSGCSALIYEIVWFQLLQLVIGSSAISLGVLLGTFMGGMCLGSLLLPRIVSARLHPLRVYAVLELGIGVLGVILLFAVPIVGRVYLQTFAHGMSSILLRAALCAICLLPPTILMGATLPAIARWMQSTREGLSELGFFYGANIAGAVFGCALAGFYLLRLYDLATATAVACGINLLVAGVSLSLSFFAGYRPAEITPQKNEWSKHKLPYIVIGISGFTALAAEVIWTRQLSLLLGASVYTFSIILSVFLVGLCIGSSLGSMWARMVRSPRMALGACQLGLAVAILWSCYALSESLPYWPIDPTMPASPWLIFQLDLMRCLWVSFPATCLWGASFPLALAVAASSGQDSGRLVAGVYAANTVGAILGSVGFSLFAVHWLGTQSAQMLVVAVTLVSAWLVLGPLLYEVLTDTVKRQRSKEEGVTTGEELPPRLAMFAPVFLVTVFSIVFLPRVSHTPRGLIAYGRNLPSYKELPDFIYVGEGMNASIAVSEFEEGIRNFHVSGKVVASSEWQDMRLQRLLGHLPALLHSQPKSVLIVGCGAGVTAGSFVAHPDIERIVICEIEPLIPPTAGKYFGDDNHHVIDDPRVEIVFDDARHFVATTTEKFDIITSDPIHPWVKGAAALYSKEYFETCLTKLNPGGMVTQWVPLYETNLEAVKSEFVTFFDVFPEATVWSNEYEGFGYDVVLLGQRGTITINADECEQRLNSQAYQRVKESLADVGYRSSMDLLETFAGQAQYLDSWLADAQLNQDGSLRLQYLAGLGLNRYAADDILRSITAHYRYPEELFESEGVHGQALKKRLLIGVSD